MKIDIITVVSYLAPFIIGWFLKSPFSKKLPNWLTTLLASMQPDTVSSIYEKVKDPSKRREYAVEVIQQEVSLHTKNDITTAQADELYDWFTRVYAKVKK